MDQDIPTDRAVTLLTAAAYATDGVVDNPPPFVYLKGFESGRFLYQVFYDADIKQITPEKLRNRVFTNIIQNIQQAGLTFDGSKQKPQYDLLPNYKQLIRKVNLFHSFSEENWLYLEQNVKSLFINEQETIITQGEPGDSMFVLIEGLLRVYINATDEQQQSEQKLIPVGKIVSGDFFGEMSLLTGKARSATIKAETESTVVEIQKTIMETLFTQHPQLIEKISAVIVEHQMKNVQSKEEWENSNQKKQEGQQMLHVLIKKIKHFFGF